MEKSKDNKFDMYSEGIIGIVGVADPESDSFFEGRESERDLEDERYFYEEDLEEADNEEHRRNVDAYREYRDSITISSREDQSEDEQDDYAENGGGILDEEIDPWEKEELLLQRCRSILEQKMETSIEKGEQNI